jgi:hypothetical protein
MALFLASMKVEKHMFFCQKFPSKKVKTITQISKKTTYFLANFMDLEQTTRKRLESFVEDSSLLFPPQKLPKDSNLRVMT